VFDALKPNFASCEVRYEMDKVPPTIKSKVIKHIRQGYSIVRAGNTGVLYSSICREFGLTNTKLLKNSTRPWHFSTNDRYNEGLKEELVEYSTADCMAHILTLSHNTNGRGTSPEHFRKYYLRDNNHAVNSGYNYNQGDDALYTDIFAMKDEKQIKQFVKKYLLTEEYKLKAEEAERFINSRDAVLLITYNAR
jgi:hypothetical protein